MYQPNVVAFGNAHTEISRRGYRPSRMSRTDIQVMRSGRLESSPVLLAGDIVARTDEAEGVRDPARPGEVLLSLGVRGG